MRKLSLLAIVLAFAILLSSCTTESISAIEKQLYDSINELYATAYDKMQFILRAWNFSIENGYGSSRFYKEYWKNLAKHLGISQIEMKEAGRKVLPTVLPPTLNFENIVNDDLAFSTYISDTDVSILIAKYAIDKKIPSSVDIIDNVKTSIKKIEGKSEAYSIFKDYYIMVLEMYDWLDSPHGSYMSVQSSLNEYNKKSSEYQRQLLFIIE